VTGFAHAYWPSPQPQAKDGGVTYWPHAGAGALLCPPLINMARRLLAQIGAAVMDAIDQSHASHDECRLDPTGHTDGDASCVTATAPTANPVTKWLVPFCTWTAPRGDSMLGRERRRPGLPLAKRQTRPYAGRARHPAAATGREKAQPEADKAAAQQSWQRMRRSGDTPQSLIT
jgi:hypothetical protein